MAFRYTATPAPLFIARINAEIAALHPERIKPWHYAANDWLARFTEVREAVKAAGISEVTVEWLWKNIRLWTRLPCYGADKRVEFCLDSKEF